MGIIINPGSKLPEEDKGEGWKNTHDQAKWYAYHWFLKPMLEEGFKDIEVKDTEVYSEGRWLFEFNHKVTGVTVQLEQHGITDLEAYKKQFIFTPRVYWNGESSSTPELKDFAEEGYKPVLTYEKEGK